MSYTNQNNIYGARPNQYNTEPDSKNLNYKKLHPIPAIEDSSMVQEASMSYEGSYSCNKGSQCHQETSCKCHQDTGCKCGTNTPCHPQPQPQPQPCNCTCQCNCNQPVKDDCNACSPSENCCKGETCNFDICKASCICTYMDVVYDEEVANGATLFQVIHPSLPNYTITAEYSQNGPCCNSCGVDSSSVFAIDNVKTTIKSLYLQNTASISTANVLVGGKNVTSLISDGSGGFSAVVDPSVMNDICNCNDKGTKSNVLINGLSNWDYMAKYEFCGKVTTNGSTCNFKIVVESSTTIPATIPDSLTFISPDVCLPKSSPQEPTTVDIHFTGNGQLVNPVITVTGGPSPSPVTLNIGGNLVLNTQAQLVVSKNTKVCVQGMIG